MIRPLCVANKTNSADPIGTGAGGVRLPKTASIATGET